MYGMAETSDFFIKKCERKSRIRYRNGVNSNPQKMHIDCRVFRVYNCVAGRNTIEICIQCTRAKERL